MANLTDRQAEYLLPMLRAVEDRILTLKGRIEKRRPVDWNANEFSLMASTARHLADDLTWIDTAIGVIRDVEEGEY